MALFNIRSKKPKLRGLEEIPAEEGDTVEITLFEGINISRNFLNPSYLGSSKVYAPGEKIEGQFIRHFKTTGSFGKRPGTGVYLAIEGLREDGAAAMVYRGAIHSYKVTKAKD